MSHLKYIIFVSFFLIIKNSSGSIEDGLTKDEYIDLTHDFSANTPLWPGRHSKFNVEIEGYTSNGIWIASKGFCISEHTSTHIDAPYHFYKEGWKLNEIPLNTMINVPGIVIDVYDKVHTIENGSLRVVDRYVLKVDDIIEWEERNGQIPPNAVILVRTGWASRWPDKKSYLGLIEDEVEDNAQPQAEPTIHLNPNVNYPGYSAASAQFLINERQVLGAGIDCISIDPGFEKVFPAHQLFLTRNRYLLENVANLHLLPPRGFQLFIVPFKIDQGTGAPARVLAKLCPEMKNVKHQEI